MKKHFKTEIIMLNKARSIDFVFIGNTDTPIYGATFRVNEKDYEHIRLYKDISGLFKFSADAHLPDWLLDKELNFNDAIFEANIDDAAKT